MRPTVSLALFLERPAGEALVEAEPERVVEALVPDVAAALPAARGRITDARVYRWPEGWTLFPPGYAARLSGLRRIDAELGRIALAGDYLYAPTVEGAVVSGVRAAERVLGRTSPE